MQTTRTSVLIAGAGPTGLTFAIELARRNVPYRIIDAAPGPFIGSRGKGLQPRTLEVFEDLGVLDAVLTTGGLYPRFRAHFGPISFAAGGLHKTVAPTPDVPYPNVWMLPQWRTDEVLRERLAQLGGAPEYGTALTSFTQDDAGATATVTRARGAETITADYLVGCDGGHSTVRKALPVRFEGESLEGERVVLADVEMEGLDPTQWHAWPLAKGCILTLCPLPGSTRFQLAAPLSKKATPPELTDDGIRAFISRGIGDKRVRVGRISWISLFRANVRMVDRYRVGRVFLAGDAAHVHPPAGGQGLNTGIQDAYNLGWKLAHVLGGAPEAVLDTYEAERLPIAASVLGLSKRLLKDRSLKRGSETQQLGLTYREGPLASDTRTKPGPLRAGDRAPDAPYVDSEGRRTRLFESFRGTHFTLLTFGDGHAATASRVGERWSSKVRVVPMTTKTDVSAHARMAYHATDSTLVLVRPDGYVGHISAPGSVAELDAYLARVTC